MSTFNEEFPKWIKDVYQRNGYDPDKWYGSEIYEKLHREAMQTYTGPAATMQDYVEAKSTEEDIKYLDFVIKIIREKGVNLSGLSDSERWKLMDDIIAEYYKSNGKRNIGKNEI
jgi:hypothetical protein